MLVNIISSENLDMVGLKMSTLYLATASASEKHTENEVSGA